MEYLLSAILYFQCTIRIQGLFKTLVMIVYNILIQITQLCFFKVDKATPFNYHPHPVDMTNLTLSREMQNMAERLAENAHDIWAKKKKEELTTCGKNC